MIITASKTKALYNALQCSDKDTNEVNPLQLR